MDKQNVVLATQWNIIRRQKHTKYWHRLQHGWTWRTLCSVREARHQRPHSVWFHLHEMPIGKSTETESRVAVARGYKERRMGSDCQWARVSFWVTKMLCRYTLMTIAQLWKPLNCVLHKGHFMVSKLNLNKTVI